MRLAEHLQHFALELRQLVQEIVQEEDTVMRQAHLAGPGDRAAADQPRVGDGVVG